MVADDLGQRNLGAYGNPDCATPALDELASQGRRFDAMHTTVALCMPSRACLYTGRYPHRNGSVGIGPIRADVPTWPEILSGAVVTGRIGKLNVQPREKFPFDHAEPLSGPAGRDPETIAAAVRAFLGAVPARRRFSLFVCLHDPHRPFPDAGAPGSRARHDPSRLSVPAFLADTAETRTELARFYDGVARLDAGVGRVLGELERAGRAEDTVVVFTSDNGMPFPFAKTTLYQAGILMPFLVRWPGVVAPGTSEASLCSFVDLLPTAIDLFDVDAPLGLDGRSLLPLLRGEEREPRDAVFAQHTEHAEPPPVPARAIRTARWKYIRNLGGEAVFQNRDMETPSWHSMLAAAERDERLAARVARLVRRPPEELYDLASDPDELDDRAGDPTVGSTLEDLRGRLRGWMDAHADPLLASWR